MVKSYTRYEPVSTFGIVSNSSNIIWLPPSAAANSTSGGRAIVGGVEQVLTWDLKTSTVLSRWQDSELQAEVCKIAHEENTGLIAVGYTDGSIRVWDSQSGEIMVTFNGHKSAVSCMAFDKDGTRLVSGSKDSDLIVWDLVGEVGLYRLRSHRDMVTQVLFVGENHLISTSKEGLIKVWDLDTQHCVETHVSHRGECWSADEKDGVVMTGGNDKEIKVWKLNWDAPVGEQLILEGTLEKSSSERSLELKFHRKRGYFTVANGDKSLEIWRCKTAEQISKSVQRKKKRQQQQNKEVTASENEVEERYNQYTVIRTPAKIHSFDWSYYEDTKELSLVTNLNNNCILAFAVDPSKKSGDYKRTMAIELPGHRTDVRSMSLSGDDKLLASASNGSLMVWNVRTNNCLRTFKCGYAVCSAFLPGDALIVVGTKSGHLELFDVASATMLEQIEAHDGECWSLDVAQDGSSMVTAGDKTVKFWEFKIVQDQIPGTERTRPRMKLKHRRTLELDDDVLSVKLSPDAKYVACSLMNYTVKVFFTDSLKFYLNLYGHKLPVLSIDISHDSKLLISCSADKNIKIWGLDFGDCHKSIFAHDDSIMDVQFEPGTHHFFSVSKDRQVKYWDGAKFDMIQRFTPAHHGEVWALIVSKASAMVITAAHDKTIRVWQQFDEPLFIEEEREKEMEEMYEKTLTDSVQADDDNSYDNNGDDLEGGEGEQKDRAGKQTIETLKAGERLMEALDIGAEDLDKEKGSNRHVILAAMKVSAAEHVMNVLSKIKPAQLEDALLVLSFDRVVKLFRFIEIWVSGNSATGDESSKFAPRVPLICRVLAFVLQVHHKQIVANKTMRQMLEAVRANLRAGLVQHRHQLGYNIAGLKVVKEAWQQQHQTYFEDDYEYAAREQRMAKKRAFV